METTLGETKERTGVPGTERHKPLCMSHYIRVHGCTFAVCAGDECALACRQVHRRTRVCDVQRYQGDAENVQAGLPMECSQVCVCASILHSCAHLCQGTYVEKLGRKGRKRREEGRSPTPTPTCSQKSTSNSEVLISSQRPEGSTQPQEFTLLYHPRGQGSLP